MPRPLLAAFCLAALAGCGGGGDDQRAARALAPVELEVTAPADTAVVDEGTVEVSGSVAPAGAEVDVMGEAASVSGGRFRASVPLQPGSNVVDVIATADERAPAMTAVRVTYELPVPVPDLEGLTVEEAQQELEGTGLELEVDYGRGLLEDLLPGVPGVCEQDPSAGTEVPVGSTVAVFARKSC